MDTRRILIVDDEVETRKSLTLIMQWLGHTVTAVEHGGLALKLILEKENDNTQYDLLICDIQMPVLTGEELIDKLYEHHIRLPFLIITGYGEKELVIRMMRKGCRDFIDKPFEPSEIEERVGLIFQESQASELEKKRLETLAKVGIRSGQFAHDMNNILTGTMGFADIALVNVDSQHPVNEYLKKIISTTSQAAEICKALQLNANNELSDELVPTEISSLVDKISTVLTDIVKQDVRVEVDIVSTQVWCMANAHRLQQALLNLGINAAQAMPDGGTIKLVCTKSESNNNNVAIIKVSDTGHGIDEKLQKNIFKVGFTTRKEGNGIGLPLVKEIIDQHKGDIAVESGIATGTTFTITVPLTQL